MRVCAHLRERLSDERPLRVRLEMFDERRGEGARRRAVARAHRAEREAGGGVGGVLGQLAKRRVKRLCALELARLERDRRVGERALRRRGAATELGRALHEGHQLRVSERTGERVDELALVHEKHSW